MWKSGLIIHIYILTGKLMTLNGLFIVISVNVWLIVRLVNGLK